MPHSKPGLDKMSTLTSLLETANNKGYTENFMVQDDGLYSPTTEVHYLPNEVTVDNFYRFEGASNPEDNAILYFIETHDGIKGTLIDSYGAGADTMITEFIKEVEEIHKKEAESKK